LEKWPLKQQIRFIQIYKDSPATSLLQQTKKQAEEFIFRLASTQS